MILMCPYGGLGAHKGGSFSYESKEMGVVEDELMEARLLLDGGVSNLG